MGTHLSERTVPARSSPGHLPLRSTHRREHTHQPLRSQNISSNLSPPYQRERRESQRRSEREGTRDTTHLRTPSERHRRNHSPRRHSPQQIWREKPHQRTETMEDNFSPNQSRPLPIGRNLDQEDFPTPPPRIQTEDQIRQDLHDIDIRYINCENQTESAARRQRVLEGNLNGQREETVAFLYNAPSNQAPPENERHFTHYPGNNPPERSYQYHPSH
ncbi:unnamed protein product [Microthlaspi erraticum]|uniref:Uncharacterized protein n=1 Tax=Microthlaspi erraticum TaxID=1685480 RepID=A0A6D2L117_9BRAS|nr:unnamed protein product [Microthlaspi erraticum]